MQATWPRGVLKPVPLGLVYRTITTLHIVFLLIHYTNMVSAAHAMKFISFSKCCAKLRDKGVHTGNIMLSAHLHVGTTETLTVFLSMGKVIDFVVKMFLFYILM